LTERWVGILGHTRFIMGSSFIASNSDYFFSAFL
jgi:hypothetical protein